MGIHMRHNELIFHSAEFGLSIIEDDGSVYGFCEEPYGNPKFNVGDADFWRERK